MKLFSHKFFAILLMALAYAVIAYFAYAAEIPNPIKSENFGQLISKIAGEIRPLAVVVAGVMIIYSGFLFVTAAGNEAKLKTAKSTFFWTIIGAAIIVGASLLADVIKNTIKNL